MGAQKMGYFSRDEFKAGLSEVRCREECQTVGMAACGGRVLVLPALHRQPSGSGNRQVAPAGPQFMLSYLAVPHLYLPPCTFPPCCPQLGATTVAQLRKVLPTLAAEVADDPYQEESLFRWSFRFCLTVRGACTRVKSRVPDLGALLMSAALVEGVSMPLYCHACLVHAPG